MNAISYLYSKDCDKNPRIFYWEGGREVVDIKNSMSPYSDEIVLYLDCGGVHKNPNKW